MIGVEGRVKQRPKSAGRSVMEIPKRQFMIDFFCNTHTTSRNIKYLHCSAKRKKQIILDQNKHNPLGDEGLINIKGKSVILEQTVPSSYAPIKHHSTVTKHQHRKNVTYSCSQLLSLQQQPLSKSYINNSAHRKFLQKPQKSNNINELSPPFHSKIQSNFSKTKILFKQQSKSKKVERIQKIYSAKFKAMSKRTTKQPIVVVQGYTPWQKNPGQTCFILNSQMHELK